MIQECIRKKILEKTISLAEFGIRDLTWEKEDAENLIVSLMADDIGILGGDVYVIDSNHPIPTYDNWFSDPEKGELPKEYFLRSKKQALDYIQAYPIEQNQIFLFSIVFTEIIE